MPARIRPRWRAILDSVKDFLAAAKLLGAGGGGYLLMFAKDDTAAARIRQLTDRPPNPRAASSISASRTRACR